MKRGLIAAIVAVVGTAIGVAIVRGRKGGKPGPAPEIPIAPVPTGPDAFEASAFGGVRLLFPAESWQNAREAGLSFDQTLAHMQADALGLVAEAANYTGLSEVYFTSLYRATGTGPHTTGRALDVGYIRKGSDPLVLLLRKDDGSPQSEPELAKRFRINLRNAGATQVLTPWWIYSKGTRDDANNGVDELDAGHRSHLHVTVPQAEAIA